MSSNMLEIFDQSAVASNILCPHDASKHYNTTINKLRKKTSLVQVYLLSISHSLLVRLTRKNKNSLRTLKARSKKQLLADFVLCKTKMCKKNKKKQTKKA